LKFGKLRKDAIKFRNEKISLQCFSAGFHPNTRDLAFPISRNYPRIVDVKPMFHVRHCDVFNTETMTAGRNANPNTAPSREPSVILPKVVSAR